MVSVDFSPPELSQLITIARRALSENQVERARDILNGVVLVQREDAAAWELLGDAHLMADAPEEARNAYAFAVTLAPCALHTHLKLAELESELGNALGGFRRATWIAREFELDADSSDRIARLLATGGAS